jgi:hypothetical protein
MLCRAALAFSLVLRFTSIYPSFAADASRAGTVWRIGYIVNSPDLLRADEVIR